MSSFNIKSMVTSCLGDSSLLRTVYDEMTVPIPEALTDEQVIATIVEEYSLTQQQVEDYRVTFDRMDTDGNGVMDTDEIRSMFYFWGDDLTDGELRAIVDEVRYLVRIYTCSSNLWSEKHFHLMDENKISYFLTFLKSPLALYIYMNLVWWRW